MPVLDAWKPVRADTQGQEYERNPYYLKVDAEGNQLPYVDKVVIEYVQNLEALTLKAISGQLSVAGRDLLLQSFPVVKQNEKQGDYTLRTVYNEQGSDVALAFNQIHPDPELRKIFSNLKFRQAMSSAIDRDEINELVFLGQGTPRQAAINSSAKFYKEEWGNSFAKYDLALANKLLDEIGLDKKGPDGVRLLPNGQPFGFQLEYLPQQGPKKEVCELVVKHWAKAGVKCDAQARERAFLLQRVQAGQHDASGWLIDRTLERTSYTYGWSGSKLGPGGNSALVFAQGWLDWLGSNGQKGTEPPEEAKKLAAAWNKWQQTRMGTPEYTAAAIEVNDIIMNVLWVIGTCGQGPQPAIVANKLENVFKANDDTKIWWGAANWSWHPQRGEQWFFKA
jgi:peptide/nickel transport system substrate-binding protein